jgi:TolA-binding protein
MRNLLFSGFLMSAVAVTPLMAQSDAIPLRVDKLEREMKAVQRKVFPGGAAVQPEIGGTSGTPETSVPSSAPITDLTARVDALETQLKTLTGQVETDTNRLKKLEDALKALKTDHEARIKALEGGGEVAANPVAIAPTAPTKPAAVLKPVAVTPRPALVAPTPTRNIATPVKGDAARKTAIAAVDIPATGDAAEDAYTYGFRLWTAKLYPEAQVKLKEFASKYAKHRRASYAQNLLGRAYLDEGKPALASVAFYDNYTKNPRGDRASESLYFLGISLTRLKKLPDACKVYSEFDDVYGAKAPADLKAKVAKGRTDAKCTA